MKFKNKKALLAKSFLILSVISLLLLFLSVYLGRVGVLGRLTGMEIQVLLLLMLSAYTFSAIVYFTIVCPHCSKRIYGIKRGYWSIMVDPATYFSNKCQYCQKEI